MVASPSASGAQLGEALRPGERTKSNSNFFYSFHQLQPNPEAIGDEPSAAPSASGSTVSMLLLPPNRSPSETKNVLARAAVRVRQRHTIRWRRLVFSVFQLSAR